MKCRKVFFYLAFLLIAINSFSQTIKFEGKILDTLQQPLVFANVIAEPKEDIAIQFAIADEKGYFQLKLQKNKTYTVKVSFLGYKTSIFTFLAVKNTVKILFFQKVKMY